MSKLKDQLRVMLPTLSKEANHNQNKEVKIRLYALNFVANSKLSVERACGDKGISTDFFYKWGRRLLKAKKLSALESKSRRPRQSPRLVTRRVEKKIRRLRTADPAYGPKRISFYLQQLYKITCAPSTVYNVLRRLGYVSKAERKARSKKHLKRYRRPTPGYIQMDIKYVPYEVQGKVHYEFNAVDHHSSWRLIRAYKTKSYESLVAFLEELESECPFSIIQIQTDNGKEFTDKYRVSSDGRPTGDHPLDLWCEARGIEHKLIAIGVKELNGKVENTHGFDDREFYSRYKESFASFESLERSVRGWNAHWNGSRHTETLGWQTPNEVIQNAYVWYLVFWLNWRDAHQPLVRLSASGHFTLETEPPLPTRKLTTAKTKSLVNRYLDWIVGEEKKYLKSVFPLPAMSQILSSDKPRDLC